jgi:hypothetical protein
VVVKANIGGSGAGMMRFDQPEDLARAVVEGRIELGLDHTAMVQEFIPGRDGHITRVEVLGGKFLYAINVFSTGDSFNLCPADICRTNDGVELSRGACAVDAPKNNLRVESYTRLCRWMSACRSSCGSGATRSRASWRPSTC